MTDQLTPEREAEIRETVEKMRFRHRAGIELCVAQCKLSLPMARDLLQALDAARAERDEARLKLDEANAMACENPPSGCECPGCELARERYG